MPGGAGLPFNHYAVTVGTNVFLHNHPVGAGGNPGSGKDPNRGSRVKMPDKSCAGEHFSSHG